MRAHTDKVQVSEKTPVQQFSALIFEPGDPQSDWDSCGELTRERKTWLTNVLCSRRMELGTAAGVAVES